jgi:hypothetical protein
MPARRESGGFARLRRVRAVQVASRDCRRVQIAPAGKSNGAKARVERRRDAATRGFWRAQPLITNLAAR